MNTLRSSLIFVFTGILFSIFTPRNTFAATSIPVDPGPVGSLFPDKQILFNDLNGVNATGQTLDLEFRFPSGVDAIYRSLPGGRDLYGWSAIIEFTGGNTVTSNPQPLSSAAVDILGNPVAPGPGFSSIGDGSSGFVRYFANYNTQFSQQQLIDFTDTPYHGVQMRFRLPDFAGNVVISRGTFTFDRRTIFGTGDHTEIITAVPEPSSAVLLSLIGIPIALRRRAAVRQTRSSHRY